MKHNIAYLILTDLILISLSSCLFHGVEEVGPVWKINNNSDNEVIVCTVHIDDDKIISSNYVDSVILVPRKFYYTVYALNSITRPEEELSRHSRTMMYFSIPEKDANLQTVKDIIEHADAYIVLQPQWMTSHGYNINYPEDCTIVTEE